MSAAVDTPAIVALNEALRLAEAGYRLTPVTITRAPNGKKRAQFHKGWRHETAWSRDPEQVRQWWVDWPDTSFAIGCAVNGIEGVDLDVKPVEDVDGVRWWSEQGLPLSTLEQRTPSGGVHSIWRVRADGLALPQEAGKSLGRGVDTRNRAGLFFAAGSYVVGEETHYEIVGRLPRLADLPETPREVVELFAEHAAAERPERATDGRIVVHDREWQSARTAEALGEIRSHSKSEGGYRAKLQHAGLFLGRAVEQDFLTRDEALRHLLDAHRSVWGPEVWPEPLKDMNDALDDGPRLERWRVPAVPTSVAGGVKINGSRLKAATVPTQRSDEPGAGDDEDERDDEDGPADEQAAQDEAWRDGVALRLRNRLMDAEAKRQQQAMEREPLAVLDLDAFLDAPQPDYLLAGALYRNGTAKVFGPPGGTKSFFLLDLALSLATGTPWHGTATTQATVHYVMAEGQATNTARALAWFHHRGVDRAAARGRFYAIPQGVLLTPEGIAGYLEQVRRDRPALVILDTKNRMMVGEENSASDVAVMVRAMDEIRRAADGACVALVDHTGISDTTRGRGSNAVEAAMDTEIRVSRDESGLGVAEVTRDKSAEPGAQWTYRIERVEYVPGLRPGTPTPAVPVPAAASAVDASVSEFGEETWWKVPRDLLPAAAQNLGGHAGSCARDMLRCLLVLSDERGLSVAEVRRHVRARCGRDYKDDHFTNGRKMLSSKDLIEAGETASGGTSSGSWRVTDHAQSEFRAASEAVSDLP